ncbi:MAG: hypothetical protein WAN23_04655 [Candidatus Acidiferrales bacterium]
MSAQQQNRGKLKSLAASAGRQESNSRDTIFAEASSNSPSGQPSITATAQIERIAHDFNNVLTLILGYGENLLKALPENRPGRSFAEEMCRAARDGERLTVELMSLAQSGPTDDAKSAAK